MKALCLTLCFALPVLAQEPPPGPPPSGGRPQRMAYDATREVTLQGTVTAVNLRNQGPGTLVTLTLQTTEKTMEVTVGPDFVLKAKGFTFAVEDAITVIGAPGQGQGITARQITRGSETLTLLDESGQPAGGPGLR